MVVVPLATLPLIMARRNARSDPPPHRRWRRVLDSKSKSWPNIFKPKLLSFKSLGLDLRITPSLSLPRAPHIPPGRPKKAENFGFFVFFQFFRLPKRTWKIASKNYRKKCENDWFWPPKNLRKSFRNASEIDVLTKMWFFIDFCSDFVVVSIFDISKISILPW